MIEINIKYWELIVGENAGTLDDSEKKALDIWKKDHWQDYEELVELYHKSSDENSINFNPENEWDELQTVLRIEKESRAGNTIRFFPWIARAAAAILIIFGVIYIFNNRYTSQDQMIMQTMVSTDQSTQKQVELPDGTIVWINKDSELLYPEEFAVNAREVYLTGEAFFDVTPNKERPFIVHAGISKTTVLGTSFNLRAYSKEDDIRLTVVSGKVAFTLTDDREGVFVTPGNMAYLNRESKQIVEGVNTDFNFLSWKTNELRFNDSPISSLVESLERHYGIDIEVEHEATYNCRFTGDFKDTEMDNALKIITKAIGSTYQKTEGTYIILGEGCK
jgi:ferric-dicitrate binding protein FerR (iron transport regulator)